MERSRLILKATSLGSVVGTLPIMLFSHYLNIDNEFRRICPGRYLADSALFIIFASILASFTISKKKVLDEESGVETEVPIQAEFTRHLIRGDITILL